MVNGHRQRATIVALSLYCVLGAALSLAGWLLDARSLTDWAASGISIQPNTAVAAILAGFGAILLPYGRRREAGVAGALVALIGLGALVQHLFDVEWRALDTTLMAGHDWGQHGALKRGLMGPAGAASWTAIGVALALAAARRGSPSRRVAAIAALVPLAIAVLSMTGYLYGVEELYASPRLTTIALQTATFIAAVACAVLASLDEQPPVAWLARGGAAGKVARLAAPVVLLAPPLLGWLGLRGELTGLYDARFGLAILVLALITLLFALTFWCTATIARNERAMRESERRVVATLESISDAFIAIDAEWRYTFVNAQAARILGLPAAELIGREVWEVFPDAAGTAAHGELNRAMRTRAVVEFEGYDPRSRRRFYNKAYPSPDGGITVYFEDVTQQRRLENITERQSALLELAASGRPSRECLRALCDAIAHVQPEARAGVCLAAADGSIAELVALEETPGSIPRGGACEIAIRDGLPVVSTNVAIDERFSAQWRDYCATHAIVATLSVPVRVAEGKPQGTFFVTFDSARTFADWEYKLAQFGADFVRVVLTREHAGRRLDEELAAITRLQALSTRLVEGFDSDALLREILAAAADLTATFKGNIQFYDPESGRLHIVAHQGHGARFLDYYLDQEHSGSCGEAARRNARVVVEDVLRFPGFAGTKDLEVLLADGVRSCQSTPLVARDGRLLGMINTHFLAPGRPTDAQLRHVDLLARMAADFVDRTRTEDALREADRRKTHFLAVLAHELRNPLAPIRTGVYLLREQSGDPAAVERTAAIMQRQVEQMVRIVDDLLDLSRISADRIELKRARTDLLPILRDALDAVDSGLRARGQRVELALPPKPIRLDADRARLVQIVSNLLQNASKFMDEGGTIELSAERDHGSAVVRVRDHGVGIPKDQLARIFEPFAQVDASVGRARGGLGIGLSLVRKLVELHGGTVEARSDGEKRGSDFVVRLPALPEDSVIETIAAPLVPVSTRGRNILIVDDNVDGGDSLALLLRLSGHTTHMARDGLEAIEAAQRVRPDAVFLDIGLPKLDGYEACRRIRAEPWGKEIVIVALTGWGQPSDRERSRDAGFDSHLVKPVSLESVVEVLAALPA